MDDQTDRTGPGSRAAGDAHDGRRPVGEVLPGIRMHPLEQGDRPDFVFALVRTRDGDGDTAWAYRTSAPPNREELLGALRIQVALLERELLEEWSGG
ncbi:hypothetical protein AB6N23_17345 [Cellulomonas sp. 179-A 9B4 NHS]|uniref:hypothetical protein n=1 Tax=Cellulomonas sp. 179-A 9B4 NHS TaxID=3142379 RepID=UPI00399F0669